MRARRHARFADGVPARARVGLTAAPRDAVRARVTDGRAGAGVRGERGGS